MSDKQPIELILMRQLASHLAYPVWLMDDKGDLVYYNAAAEELLGVRFDDAGPLRASELVDTFKVSDEHGDPIEDQDLPVLTSFIEKISAHRKVRFCGLDGRWRSVQITSMPLVGQGERFVGVFAAFWEQDF